MKKVFVIAASALLLLGAGIAASAGTYVLHLTDFERYYWTSVSPESGYTHSIDFGQEFSRINSITLDWSGWAQAYNEVIGEGGVFVSQPSEWQLRVDLLDTTLGYGSIGTAWGQGLATFDLHDPNVQFESLLDGKADLRVSFVQNGNSASSEAHITHAQLTIDATPIGEPVPEPSSLLTLIGGIGTMGGFVIRRWK